MTSRTIHCTFLALFFWCAASSWADEKVTRTYRLKYSDVSNIASAINVAVRDPAKTRVVGGQGKHLVVSDTPDQQDVIAQLLPVLDQPIQETDPDKIQMKMLMNAAQYLRQQKISMKSAMTASAAPAPAASTAAQATGVQSVDKFKPVTPYKSIYTDEDEKLTRGPRKIEDEPAILSLEGLELKGIFKGRQGSTIALLSDGLTNYTAHDGGLYERNRVRLKKVTSRVHKDGVTLIGQDGISHEIKFKTTL